MNLFELNDHEQDQLSDALISELKAIAGGNFVLGGDPILISTQQSVSSYVKSNRINLLSLGAYTVKEESINDLDAQSNLATNEQDSQNMTSIMLHSEYGQKQVKSNTLAEANKPASGAYGSEVAYSTSVIYQKGGYPLRQILVNEADEDDEEEFEEEIEEEFEEELTCE